MYKKDYDRLINEFRTKIQELESEKEVDQKRVDGMAKLDSELERFYGQYNLSDSDLIAYKAEAFLEWLKEIEKAEERPAVFDDLKSYFAKVIDKEGARRRRGSGSAAKPTGPRLEVGVYKNPHTGETFEKIKRNPKPLDNWIEEYGFDTVQSWKQ